MNPLTVRDTSDNPVTALGSVELGANYADNVDFTGSTMSASGDTVTIVLGTPVTGGIHTVVVPTMMDWTAPAGSVTEGGLPDVEF